MDQINFLADGWSYHEMNYLNLRPPLAEQEDEMIKNKCLRALRRMSISSRFFDDLDTQIIMNSASDPAGVNSNCEEAIEVGQLLGSGAFSDVRAMRRKGRTGSTDEKRRCSMDLTVSTCEVSTIGDGTMSVDDTKSSVISTTDTKSSGISTTTNLNNKYRFYKGSLSTIDSARLLGEEHDEDSDGSQPDDAKYAVKTLRNDLLGETKISGAIDLTIEAHFLSRLSHSHIVKLHGFGGVPGSSDFSIVVDRVQENLSSAIQTFRRQRERLKLRGISRTGAKLDKKDKIVALQTDFDDRVVIARQLASALQYLHENSILYRDLKPQNVGLDDKGRVKMFDFGLAKELKPEFKVGVDQYTGRKETGSRRYMAPEVFGSDAYGLPADVFSFTVVFWQLMSFQTPYKGLDMEAHANEVYVKKRRPAIKMMWPRSLKVMIAKGWADDPSRRPKMNDCLRTLDDYLRS